MLILQEGEICPYGNRCPYNTDKTCHGALPSRGNIFNCDYVQNGQIIETGSPRLTGDKTGRMKVIME